MTELKVANLRKIADEVQKHFCVPYAQDIDDAADEIEQLRADISEAYYLRDKAEGRFCTALGTIEQLHAAVKAAQELAATRLMEIGRLSKREKNLMDVIDSRDRALGFVPLDEVHASEPREQRYSAEDYERVIAAGGNMWSTLERLREMAMENHGHNSKGAEAFRAFADEHARLMRIRASAPQGASRDASSGLTLSPDGTQLGHWKPLDINAVLGQPSDHPFDAACACQLCRDKLAEWNADKSSPADLVGALQDVVHTDPGAARAGHAVRDASSAGCSRAHPHENMSAECLRLSNIATENLNRCDDYPNCIVCGPT